MSETANRDRTTVDRVSGRELRITRTFRGRPETLFDAWTRPELVRRWWAPASRGVAVQICEADVRPGGTYRYVIGRSAHETYAFSGRYLEIERPSRLVYTQRFEPMPGEATITVSFEAMDGGTRMVSREVYPSDEALEAALSSGMEDGMRETFDQLDDLVAELDRS